MNKIGFIGGGALAESIIGGISGKTFAPENIFVSEIRAARCAELADCRSQTQGRRENFCRAKK